MYIISCNSCRFVSATEDNAASGECHRYPPVAVDGFPTVLLASDWCGEFKRPRFDFSAPSADSVGNESTSYAKGE